MWEQAFAKEQVLQKGVEKRVPQGNTLLTRTGAGTGGHSPSALGLMCGQPGVGRVGWRPAEGRQVNQG